MRQCSRAKNSKEISKSTKPREIIATVRKQKTELNNQLQPVHLQREGIPPYGIYHFKPKRRKKNYRREDIFGFNTKFFKLKYHEIKMRLTVRKFYLERSTVKQQCEA